MWRLVSEPWRGPEATGGAQLGKDTLLIFSTDLARGSGKLSPSWAETYQQQVKSHRGQVWERGT